MDARWLLQQVRQRLVPVYGQRLKGLVLYGSEARGEAESDSDVDVLVLLEGEVHLLEDISKIVDATYDLVLSTGRPLHAMPARNDEYLQQESPLYIRARQEGITA